jgi:formylglycine-generating enzyme required for sulfatase activity
MLSFMVELVPMPAPRSGEDWTIPGLGLKMVSIAPGTFMMGSPETEAGRGTRESLHEVTLSKNYWLGEYVVTVGQFSVFVNAAHYQTQAERSDGMYVSTAAGTLWEKRVGASWRNPSLMQDENYPVVGVSWYDAQAFCAWLNERERVAGRLPLAYAYTLPTEAQWEYACRAGEAGPAIGNLDEMAWYGRNSGATTHPVGQKKPNRWRLYDMQGNVLQWCLDWFGNYPTGRVIDPLGPPAGSFRVDRGGSWFASAAGCRPACRLGNSPASRASNHGFRIALSAVR